MNLISVIISFLVATHAASAFSPPTRPLKTTFTKMKMIQDVPAPVQQLQMPSAISSMSRVQTSSPIDQGISKWSAADSSITVSLQERKIPTKEEIAAKKRNFNLLFWGGGFVAPFIATVFYFGFKFWEK